MRLVRNIVAEQPPSSVSAASWQFSWQPHCSLLVASEQFPSSPLAVLAAGAGAGRFGPAAAETS
eukprot:1309000-Lingulodinium_polyedra.AAC.1